MATTVNENKDGEATNGTTEEGNTSDIKNTTSVPQNESTDIETTEPTNDVAEEADESRTDEEKEFANESNPNQKGRDEATQGAETDQDGNPRTDGYSYGVSADDTAGTVPEETNTASEEGPEVDNAGSVYTEPQDNVEINTNANNEEWDTKKQQKLEDALSAPKDGIVARVTTSLGKYVRIKFFYNNKPLGTYISRNFKQGQAKSYLNRVRKSRDI